MAEGGSGEIQLLEGVGGGIQSPSSPSFTLTTISWQKNNITMKKEITVYCVLFFLLISSATIALCSFMYHHISYLIIGVFGALISLSLFALYYIRHCFGICFRNTNELTFNENNANVEIRQNGILIASIEFHKFIGVSYQDRFVYVHKASGNIQVPGAQNNAPPQDIISLNKYRCDSSQGKQFVLTIGDIWPLIHKKYQSSSFQPLSIV